MEERGRDVVSLPFFFLSSFEDPSLVEGRKKEKNKKADTKKRTTNDLYPSPPPV